MPAPAPAIAGYVPTYANRQPYLTVQEFLNAPTGVDPGQLVPRGTSAANNAALTQLITRASDYADNLCFQVLGATVDIQVGQYRMFRDGSIRVPVSYAPLVAVTGVSVGWQANNLVPLTDLSGVWLSRKVARIPVLGVFTTWTTSATPSATADWGDLFAQVTYVNGYANTTLGSSVSSGASSFSPVSPTGIAPGLQLSINDADKSEIVTVAPTYTLGAASVPIVGTFGSSHAVGVAVSAMPGSIKQAVIYLTAGLIKTRGSASIVVPGFGGAPTSTQKMEPGGLEEYDLAVDLLEPFKRAR